MSEKRKNGQQIAKETVDRFDAWEERMSDDDFAKIEYQGQIKRTEIMAACDCGLPALTQNKKLKARIKEVEDRLRRKGVYPPKSSINSQYIEEKSVEFQQNASIERQEKEQ